MNLTKSQILSLSIVVLAMGYILSVLFKLNGLQTISRGMIFPLFVLLYFLQSKTKNIFFAGFLILFSISESIYAFCPGNNYIYYFCNTMSVLAYLSLAIYFIRRMNVFILFNRFKVFLLVLVICNSYIVYMLNDIILSDPNVNFLTVAFFLECFYNLSILIALSFSLLSYLYHDSKEDLLLFLATACIVFSEVVQVANMYASENNLLAVIYAVLFTAGLALVYAYIISKMNTYYRVLF